MRQTRTRTIQEEIVVCDRCHREMDPESTDLEWQERIAIRFRAGYGSVFGDGNLVEADICQYCLQEVFGKYLRITEDEPFDPGTSSATKHPGPTRNISCSKFWRRRIS